MPMDEKSKSYTTFLSSRSLMRFRAMPFAIVNFGFTQVSELLDKKQNLESYDDDNDYDKLRRSNNCCKCP